MLISKLRKEDKVRLFIFLFLLCIFVAGCGGEQEAKEWVILDYPPDGSKLSEGKITFRWHIENGRDGITYNYTILFDKGSNPFDGWVECSYETGEITEYTENMSAGWWRTGFVWGVIAQSSDGYVDYSESRAATIR